VFILGALFDVFFGALARVLVNAMADCITVSTVLVAGSVR
jgi:hypothetical protein